MLFDKIVFGPLKSRRLGISLGINLLATDNKICNFDCVYCECGWTPGKIRTAVKFNPYDAVMKAARSEFVRCREKGIRIRSVTFAGNGEPTLHPRFHEIIHGVAALRDRLLPGTAISVLSNATCLHKKNVREGLDIADNRILKLDTGTEAGFRLVNRPAGKLTLAKVCAYLAEMREKIIIQTLFFRGMIGGTYFDNTKGGEFHAWLERIREIRPLQVMVYTLDRATPLQGLEKATLMERENIGKILRAEGILGAVT